MSIRKVDQAALDLAAKITKYGIDEAQLQTISVTLLEKIVGSGLAGTTKTMYDVAMIYSIDQARRMHQKERLSDHRLGVLLKISPQRVKTLRYQADLHYVEDHELEAQLQLLAYVARAVPDTEGRIVRLQITSKLARVW